MNFNLATAKVDRRLHQVGSRLLLPRWFAYQARRMRVAYWPAFRRHQRRKSWPRVASDLIVLSARWRCLPFHYFRYQLYNPAITREQALEYIPETVFYYRILNHVNEDVVLLDDKRLTHLLLSAGRIAKPLLLGWSSNGQDAIDSSGKDRAVVIKPARYSSGGAGILRLQLSGGAVLSQDGRPFDLARYRREWGDWILEEFVNGVGGRPLRTLRVITMAKPTSRPVVRYVVQKLQAEASLVTDNAHSGGLYVGVDEATGQLGRYAYDEALQVREHDPLTGIPFADTRIADIPDVIRLAEAAAALLPKTVLIGWDIGLSENGPVVIEGNSSPGLTNIQRTHGGVARDVLAWYRALSAR
jgi:hypothetical protein